MSDKSFGDHTNRNVVKNPLLSSAVTGLSIEDLTNKAVLLPVTPSQGLITRPEPQDRTLAHPEPDHNANPPKNDPPNDDFDVNEYFARLQGTRYVSAPIHTTMPDPNLEPAEDLEEINLEPERVEQQSITADIAQNFSQLPTVLPHVANAVFSSFSNMLSLRREASTPEVKASEPWKEEVNPGVSEEVNVGFSVAPPPKEPPVGGGGNFRITSKKKYAQIPGLSSGTPAPVAFDPAVPSCSNAPPPSAQNNNPNNANNNAINNNEPVNNPNNDAARAPSPQAPRVNEMVINPNSSIGDTTNPEAYRYIFEQGIPFPNVHNYPFQVNPKVIQDKSKEYVPDLFAVRDEYKPAQMLQSNFYTQCGPYDPYPKEGYVIPDLPQNFLPPREPTPPVIPPPPMFSNRRDQQPSGRGVLPPSVARRLGANQPVIRQQEVAPNVVDNIFVPNFDNENAQAGPSQATSQNAQSNPPFSMLVPTDSAASSTSPTDSKSTEQGTASSVPMLDFNATSNVSRPPQTGTSNFIPMFASSSSANISAANVGLPSTVPTAESAIPMHSSQASQQPTASVFDPTSNQPTSVGPTASNDFLPTFFYPVQGDYEKQKPVPSAQNTPTEPPKPLAEPPKATGASNYRMTKKRPQYYSGPIEGVGSISNNVKPIIPPVDTSFQGAMFSPEQPSAPTFPIEPTIQPIPDATPFDISKPNYTEADYNTTFDLSRPTTEMYEKMDEKQESKSTFGLIGSLKSKLSSIDINKIQNSVTSFFDPAFNEPKVDEPASQDNKPYEQQSNQYMAESNFDIFVPTVEQTANYGQYDYNNQNTSYYGQNNQFYQPHSYYSEPQTTGISSVYNPYFPTTAQSTIDTVEQPKSEAQQVSDTKNFDEMDDAQIIEAAMSGRIRFESIVDDTKMPKKETKKEDTDFTSNVPAEVMESYQNITSLSDLAAKNFFDNAFVDNPIKTEDNAKIDLQYATGDKAEINKPFTDFAFKDIANDGGDDKIFEEVLSSIIGDDTAFDAKTSAEPVIPFKEEKEDPKPLFIEPPKPDPIPFLSNTPQISLPEILGSLAENAPQEIKIRETNLLESLITDAIPIVAVSSVPLFGLSTIIADVVKDPKNDVKPSIFETPKDFGERRLSITFYENPASKKIEKDTVKDSEANRDVNKHITDLAADIKNVSLFDAPKDDKTIKSFFDEGTAPIKLEDQEAVSELSICETCREVTKVEEKDSEDLTTQLIGNMTAPFQLLNTVEATLTEGDTTENRTSFDKNQCAEIMHITEETIDTINVQSATDLLEDGMKDARNYGWCDPETFPEKAMSDHDYSFKLDSNSIGFFGNNSLFFDNVPNNASDEIKAEFKNSHEDMLSRQVSVPSAPPAEDDTKSDETGGLDVHSIEQDAKKDFPIYEEFVIEPSETDDDKIEYKEREKSEDPVPEIDSFTNRVERFKKMEEISVETDQTHEVFDNKLFDLKPKNSPAIAIASYFDTGNYAAETHYRNSLNSPSFQFGSPNIPMRIPPGFEDEFHRRVSGISLQDSAEIERLIQRDIHHVPETSTQTPHTGTTTYVSSSSEPTEVGFDIKSNLVSLVEDDPTPIPASPEIKPRDPSPKPIVEPVQPSPVKLPDPINFFSNETNETEAPESFNRLASYFSSPKDDKSFFDSNQNRADSNSAAHKSFFELSQGQNHYIDSNIPDDTRAVMDVMRDLTSVQNIVVTKEQIVRTVNYFTVEYDKIDDIKSSPIKETKDAVEDNLNSFVNCEFCFKNTLVNIVDVKYKVRQLMNDNTEGKKDTDTMEPSSDPRRSVSLNLNDYTLQDDAKEGVTVAHENRSSSEYSPVKYHWFYSVEVDDKSIWRGFSITDSRALEDAFNSPDLNEATVVATDGGRYDVNVVKRTRTAVYWTEKPTSVCRCSWFYKGPTDARYVPYSETVAQKLEEEYHHGMTTGEWHRRLMLPNSELVVMHGPTVMVHFLNGGSADAFSGNLFAFGKRVYRNPPKIRVARDQPEKMDHLILLVHGAGEYRSQKEKIQSTSRPRVVRRGHDESEIEDSEPSSIDHLLLLCHGVGSACDMRFRSVEEVVDDFRATSLQLVQSHYKNSYDNGTVSRVEVLPISWHSTLHSGETGVDRRLAQITLESIPRLRNFTNDTVLDVLFYTSPVYCQTIIDTVCSELNRIYNLFVSRNPTFRGRVSLGGHSLGSVILYDLLCHQPQEVVNGGLPDKKLVTGPAGTGQLSVKYPKLQFKPAAMYALGSPIAIFECIRGVEALGAEFSLPTCDSFFNIFHPYDPIAYRIEPLINPRLKEVKPSLIPHHKGRKRMHLELKDTMSRVGADLKQKLIESLRTTWNKWMSQPPTDGQLEKVVEEEMEKEQLCDENKEEFEKQLTSMGLVGKLNNGRRVDYVLQEAPLELINEYLFAMRSHVGYWESEDTMLLMLREIYDALGVQPDCTVPQQSLTVHRTKMQDETIVIDHPSTSRGGT